MSKLVVYFVSTFAWCLFLLSVYPSDVNPLSRVMASFFLALGTSSTILMAIKD